MPASPTSTSSPRSSSEPTTAMSLTSNEARLILLERQLQAEKERNASDSDSDTVGKKRKAKQPSTQWYGRGIPKLVALFGDLEAMLDDALKYELRDLGDTSQDDADFENKDAGEIEKIKNEQTRAYRNILAFCKLLPSFHKRFVDNPLEIKSICAQGATSARGDDISKLGKTIPIWINEQWRDATPLNVKDRNTRGLYHDITGMLLCPITLDWDDENLRAQLRNFSYEGNMYANHLLRCLYFNFKGNPQHPDKGFLKSALLVKTFKHIFTSPNSADDVSILVRNEAEAAPSGLENVPPPPKTRRTNKRKPKVRKAVSAKLQMTEVTPRSIAYTAVQVGVDMQICHSYY
ncbi:hypothetical protein CPB83DRAFT_890899 [Crepidotus variabilis]|uniref:Uncharacterized protein n=1 Tax=Crepidotus variabilis TaxID=179855 RepID=A0A9P6ENK7_9AGAR|nr:hypothetical protein CPB83DRAFT_890899 [Crepidotus variabilis]